MALPRPIHRRAPPDTQAMVAWRLNSGRESHGATGRRVVHTLEDAEIIEVSTPQLEDIVCLEDLYGRGIRQ